MPPSVEWREDHSLTLEPVILPSLKAAVAIRIMAGRGRFGLFCAASLESLRYHLRVTVDVGWVE